jgi:hypothetical protein
MRSRYAEAVGASAAPPVKSLVDDPTCKGPKMKERLSSCVAVRRIARFAGGATHTVLEYVKANCVIDSSAQVEQRESAIER